MMITHQYSTGSCRLDSDSEEDPSDIQSTGGSTTSALDGDKDDDLMLSSSICHFEEEINNKRIGNNYHNIHDCG